MGDRANYAIRENGVVRLFYSQWGAVTIAEDIFWGPARTEAFIRKNVECQDWLDSVWAQGGIALDKDRRHATYYYLEWPDGEHDIRLVYEGLLSETWGSSGWSVARVEKWGDLAEAVGVDRAMVTAQPTEPRTFTALDLGRNLDRGVCCALLAVQSDGEWSDYAIDFSLECVLMNGPALLEQLPQVAGMARLRDAMQNQPAGDASTPIVDMLNSFARIHTAQQKLEYTLPDYFEHSALEFIQQKWQGWTVEHLPGIDIHEHYSRTGRETPADFHPSPKPEPTEPAPPRSYEECVRLIREHLAQNEGRKDKSSAMFQELVATLKQQGDGPVTVAPDALRRIPSSKPNRPERFRFALRRILSRLS